MKRIYTLKKPFIRSNKTHTITSTFSISSFIAIATFILLTGSFLNNFLLFEAFNIDVSNYFDAKDYIASSTRIFAIFILSMTIGIILIIIESRQQPALEKNVKKQENIIMSYMKKIVVILIGIAYLKFTGWDNFEIVLLIMLMLIVKPCFKFAEILSKRFHNSNIKIITVLVSMFYISVLFITLLQINAVSKYKNKNFFYLEKNMDIDINSKKYIKSISNYSFFYDSENRKTIVIPNSDILRIERDCNPDNSYTFLDIKNNSSKIFSILSNYFRE